MRSPEVKRSTNERVVEASMTPSNKILYVREYGLTLLDDIWQGGYPPHLQEIEESAAVEGDKVIVVPSSNAITPL